MHLLVFLLVLSLAPIPASADNTCKAGTFSSDVLPVPHRAVHAAQASISPARVRRLARRAREWVFPPGSTSISACTTSSGGLTTCDQTSLTTCPATGAMTSHNPRYIARRQTCPRGHKNCPVYGLSGNKRVVKHYECVGVDHDLESCGGCVNDDSPFGERTADGGGTAVPSQTLIGFAVRAGSVRYQRAATAIISRAMEKCASHLSLLSLSLMSGLLTAQKMLSACTLNGLHGFRVKRARNRLSTREASEA
ncbi:hypothetical protein A0H81_08574 [Grifola frondosa]|uniref:Glucosidase 2 subunit beta n=1 Tax=Grifola frondosa TaxID=5627 RepID=A0A1C7M3G5_GRIFR|nr:hypothetical protein A0H81_08574 [Grifola frondosa]